jgi:hypothetical protein
MHKYITCHTREVAHADPVEDASQVQAEADIDLLHSPPCQEQKIVIYVTALLWIW